MGEDFAIIVLRQVHDVALALFLRWPLCTVYMPTSREGATWLAWREALRGDRSLAARWQIYSRVRG
jgi:hypothetical protein